MSKPDFDFSKYVEVPESWIENALNIPNTVNSQPKAFPVRRIVAAASIVLVAVLGVSLYFLFGNKSPIPVAPIKPTDSAQTMTETASVDTESVTLTERMTTSATTPPSAPSTSAATQIATDSEGEIIVITTITTRTEHTPSDATPISPATTQAPAVTPSEEPAVPPTQAATEISVPTAPTPTEPNIRTLELNLRLSEMIATVAEDGDSTLYCCIYDSAGNPIGDPDLYSRGHLLDIRPDGYQSQEVIYHYSVDYDANTVPDGGFTYRIYLSSGTVLNKGTI